MDPVIGAIIVALIQAVLAPVISYMTSSPKGRDDAPAQWDPDIRRGGGRYEYDIRPAGRRDIRRVEPWGGVQKFITYVMLLFFGVGSLFVTFLALTGAARAPARQMPLVIVVWVGALASWAAFFWCLKRIRSRTQ